MDCNYNQIDYVLLIQGPIRSCGATYIDRNSLKVFNSEETIMKNIIAAKAIFSLVILSTYINQVTDNFSQKLKTHGVIVVDNSMLEEEEFFHSKTHRKNSKKLQLETTLNGLNRIKSLTKSNPFVLKIRTDTSISFTFVDESLDNKKYYFQYVNLVAGNSLLGKLLKKLGILLLDLPDFFIGASLNNILNLFNQMVDNPMASSIHQSLIINLLKIKGKPIIRLNFIELSMKSSDFIILKKTTHNILTYINMIIFTLYYKRYIRVMGKPTSLTSVWRGTSYLNEISNFNNRVYTFK